ncbi:MAG TPA: hypothetical protein VK571_10970 [Gemmatimonadaceae bacterium]|nr:hypothetical protein [Gemmatimonadaceae bacterium]
MKYTLFRLPENVPSPRMTLETFCEAYNCSLIVEEQIGLLRFSARLTGIDVTNGQGCIMVFGIPGGSGDLRYGQGLSPESAIRDYFDKIQGHEVTCVQSDCRIKMPFIEIGALEAIER